MTQNINYLTSIPNDLIIEVLTHVDSPDDLASCSCVDKKLNDLTNHQVVALWKKRYPELVIAEGKKIRNYLVGSASELAFRTEQFFSKNKQGKIIFKLPCQASLIVYAGEKKIPQQITEQALYLAPSVSISPGENCETYLDKNVQNSRSIIFGNKIAKGPQLDAIKLKLEPILENHLKSLTGDLKVFYVIMLLALLFKAILVV